MLELEINGKLIPFKFGVGFLRRANTKYKEVSLSSGVSIENGLRYLIARAEDGHVDALAEILLMANKGLRPSVTSDTLDNYIDDESDPDKLWEEVKSFLSESAACKKILAATMEMIHPQPAKTEPTE